MFGKKINRVVVVNRSYKKREQKSSDLIFEVINRVSDTNFSFFSTNARKRKKKKLFLINKEKESDKYLLVVFIFFSLFRSRKKV